jgi:gliding motility-associated-like protein
VAQVTAVADPTISTQPTATQTICVGGAPSNLTLAYSNGTGTATYQWYSNTTNSTTGGTSIAGATSATYAPPVINTAGNYYYYGIATLSGTGCGTATSAVAQVTVVADPTMTTQPLSTQTVCQSAPATALAVAYSGGTGVATYQWYSNTSNSTTGGTLIAGAVNASYTPATATVGTQYYYCIVTLAGTGCNTVTSSVATVVVTQGPSVSTQPLTTQTICAGGTVTQLTVAYSNGTGTPSYQWYSNTTNSTTGGTLIAGATNANYTPVAPTAGTTYYYCQISFTGGGCSSIVSNTATVAAVALPTITSQPTATQTICVGGAPSSLTLAYSNGTGTPTYQWYSNTTNSITGGTAIAGATAATYVPPVLNTAGSYFYYGIATLSGSGCGTTTTAVAQVTVVADPTITTQPLASQTVCQNGIATALTPVLTGGTGNFSYAWFTNLTNSTVGGIPSGSAATLNPITAVVGTAYVYCVITQSGLGCSTLTTTASQVTVVSAPTISTQPLASQSLCLNGIPTNLSVAYTNGTGTPSYQWYSNVNATNVGGTAIAGATNASYTPPTNTAGTFNYYCEISLSGAGCGSITSSAVQVIVNDLPTISTQPIAGGTICVGGTPPAFSVAYTGGSGTATYQWYSNATNSNTGGAAIVGATLDTFSAPALNTAGNYFYYATVSLTGAGCGSVSSNTTEVIVVDDATINGQPLTTNSVCEGAVIPALTFGTLNGTGLSTYQWYSNTVNSNSGGLALPNETNATFVPPASATGTTYYYCLINFSGSGCNSTTTATSEVIVVPQPSISTQPLSTQTICLDGIPNALTGAYSNGTGTPSYQWYSNATNTTTGGVLIPGATNDSYTPSGNAVGSQYYYLTVSLSGLSCNATTSASSEIVVVADPVISTEPLTLDSLCVGGNPNQLQVTITGGTGVTSYQWYSNINAQNTGGTAIPGETNATFTPPTSNAPGDYFYYVVGSLNGLGCDAVTSTVSTNTFVSDPSIVTQPLTTQTLCVNDASTDLSFTYADGFGNPTIEWFSNASNSTIGGTLLTEVSNTLAPVNTPDGTTYYYATVTLSGNGCDAVTTAISEVIVNPLPTISITALQDSICFGQSTDLSATGAQDYQWTTDPTITTADNLDVISVSPVGSVTYVVTGTDAIGCVNTNSFTVYAADQLNVNEANVTTVCYATCTGEIDLTPNGGVPNYQVVWSDPTLVGLTLANLCPATYDYTLTDNLGCTFSNTIVITELPDNPIDNVILTQPLCFQDANGSVEIQDVNATSFNVFNALTGVGIGAQASGIFNNLSAGTYNVQIIDAQGCVFDSLDLVLSEQSAEIILTVDAQPNLFCFGQLVPLTATASGGDSNLTITWADCNNIPACVLGSGSPFNYNINQDITIYAQVIDGLGCLGTIESVALDMSDAISLQIQNGTLLEEICEGECVDMTAAVSGGNNNLTIQWYEIGTPVGGTTLGPDGLTNTICPPVSTGVYVYADDGCNAPASDTLLITVFEVPDVTFTVSAQEGCYPVTVQFNNTTDPNLIGNCIWTMGDGTTIADCSPQTYTYDEVGSYTPSLFVMSPDGCSSSTSLAAPINVWDYPVADFAWTPDPVNVLETEVQFSNLSVDGDTYDWTFATFGSSTEPNPMWTFPDVDLAVYPVCLETTNIHGCTNSICYEILIESILQIWVPNAFTPDNDGKNDVFLPVINGANPENYHFAIYDRWGTLMFETNNLGEAWIGNIRGGEYYPKSDSFVWRIEVEHLSDRRLEVLEGTVTLLR